MNYDLYVKELFDNFNKEIDGINYNKYYFSIENVVSSLKNLSDNDFENVVEITINQLFQMIKKSKNAKKCEEYDDLWVEIQWQFTDINTKDNIWEQADCISDDLIKKTLSDDGRTFELPVKIKYIKQYSIVYGFGEEDIKIMLEYIVLQLLILNYLLNNVDI